ncbi:MAG: peptidoglycan DD-metalloendopeptidase family protein [Elusimicrobia bacterium]|nr:peptidoglycan DD-metalloendopeptidase family protein [Elusimicrobiota bacterium]
MKSSAGRTAPAVLLLALAAPVRCDDGAFARYRPAAERVAAALNAADGAALENDIAEGSRKVITPEKLTAFFSGFLKDYGRLKSLDPAELRPPYVVFPARFERGAVDIRLIFDNEGKISSLSFIALSDPSPGAVLHEAHLRLPFAGRWLVFWGGDTKEQNAHHDAPNQRYAFDFVAVDAKGSTHKGEGKANADYFAYGRAVLAPADGVVTQAIDGVVENAPGSMNPYSALGNAVVIQHKNGEVSVLAHLQPGSLKVKKGLHVLAGQAVGLCGNSGNSSEPHLHYHLQDAAVIQDGRGVKVFFRGPKGGFSPVKGDVVGS